MSDTPLFEVTDLLARIDELTHEVNEQAITIESLENAQKCETCRTWEESYLQLRENKAELAKKNTELEAELADLKTAHRATLDRIDAMTRTHSAETSTGATRIQTHKQALNALTALL